jgi:hypothetical protein
VLECDAPDMLARGIDAVARVWGPAP